MFDYLTSLTCFLVANCGNKKKNNNTWTKISNPLLKYKKRRINVGMDGRTDRHSDIKRGVIKIFEWIYKNELVCLPDFCSLLQLHLMWLLLPVAWVKKILVKGVSVVNATDLKSKQHWLTVTIIK